MKTMLYLSVAALAWTAAAPFALAQERQPAPQTQTPAPASTEEGRRMIDRQLQLRPGETRVQALDRQERERAAADAARRQNEANQRQRMDQQSRDFRQNLDAAVANGTMTPEGRAQVQASVQRSINAVIDRIDRMDVQMTQEQEAQVAQIIGSFQARVVNGQPQLTGGEGDARLVVDTVDLLLDLQQTLNRDLEPVIVDMITIIEGGMRDISYVPGIRTAVPDIDATIDGLSRVPRQVQSGFGGINYQIDNARSAIEENRTEYERRAQVYLDELHGRTLRDTVEELDRLYPTTDPTARPAPPAPGPSASPVPSGEPTVSGRSRAPSPSREGLNPDGTPIGDPYAGLRVPQPQQQTRQTPVPTPRPRQTQTQTPPRRNQPPPPVTLTQATPPPTSDGERVNQPISPRGPSAQNAPTPVTWTVGNTTYSVTVYFENGQLNYRYTEMRRPAPRGGAGAGGGGGEGSASGGDYIALERPFTIEDMGVRDIPSEPGPYDYEPSGDGFVLTDEQSQQFMLELILRDIMEAQGGAAMNTLVSNPALEAAMGGAWNDADALARAAAALRQAQLRMPAARDPYPGLGEPNGLSVLDLEPIYEGWDPYANGFHYPGPSSAGTSLSSAGNSLRVDWYLPPAQDLSAQVAADRAAGYFARGASEMGMAIDWGGFNIAADPFRVNDPSRRSPLGELWATNTTAGEDLWGGRLYGDRNPWAYQPLTDTSRDFARLLYGPLRSDRPFEWAYDPSGLDNEFSQEGMTVAWLNGMSQRDYLRALVSGDTTALSRLLAQPFNVLLTWGPGAFDLDLHMTGPSGTSAAQRFHIYYAATGRLDDFPFAQLIRDCICASGSEVILTSNLIQGGVYRVSVFNFGNQSATSTNLANGSQAVLQIVRGGQAVPQGNGTTIVGGTVIYTGAPPPDQPGNTWVAVEIDPRTGRIRAPNVITQNQGSGSVP